MFYSQDLSIAVSVFYWFVAASIAELASAIPSAGGGESDAYILKHGRLPEPTNALATVYHWASVTAGRYGRMCGYFAGWWNFFAWIFGLAALAQIVGAQTVSMYALMHPGFVIDRWHVFVAYLVANWVCCLACLFANKLLPAVQRAGGFLIVAGVSITIIVCAVLPSVNDQPYASTDFVWRQWANSTGYSMDGFVFCLGMLTGAFAVGTPDVITHMAEEIPDPNINMPKAILAQYVVGFFSSFFYLIALFYGINDLDGVLESRFLFPLAEIYRQCTGSAGGSLGLLILVFLPTFISLIGCYLTASRTFWTLSRDNATPFAPFFSVRSQRYRFQGTSLPIRTKPDFLAVTYVPNRSLGTVVTVGTLP
jgi:choline transport protein